MAIITVSDKKDFETQVLKNKKLVLVDFWAEWCPPCRMMEPVLEKASEKFKDEVDIVKVNIETSNDNRQLAIDYEVQGIPNMQIFKNGKVVDQLIGMRPQGTLEDELRVHLD